MSTLTCLKDEVLTPFVPEDRLRSQLLEYRFAIHTCVDTMGFSGNWRENNATPTTHGKLEDSFQTRRSLTLARTPMSLVLPFLSCLQKSGLKM